MWNIWGIFDVLKTVQEYQVFPNCTGSDVSKTAAADEWEWNTACVREFLSLASHLCDTVRSEKEKNLHK